MALIEVLVYIALFLVVAGMAFALFYRTEEQSRSLRRSAEDIAAVLKAGERWRADVRAALAPPSIDSAADAPGIRIRSREGEIRYFARDGAVWRKGPASNAPVELLPRVQSTAFEKDQRQFVAAWRWTLELKKYRHQGSLKPVFTFIAVPEKKS